MAQDAGFASSGAGVIRLLSNELEDSTKRRRILNGATSNLPIFDGIRRIAPVSSLKTVRHIGADGSGLQVRIPMIFVDPRAVPGVVVAGADVSVAPDLEPRSSSRTTSASFTWVFNFSTP